MNELIIVKQLPIIEEHLKDIKSEIENRVGTALEMECTEDTRKEVKKIRAELSAEFRELEEKRAIVKKAVMDPYNQFETVYKECVSNIYKDADGQLKSRIDAVEDEIKGKKAEAIERYYNELAESLEIDFAPFSSSGITVNMSTSEAALKKQCETYLGRITEDIAMINSTDDALEVMVEYKKHLNASRAITDVNARKKALEEARQRAEKEKEAKARREEIIQKVVAAMPKVEPPKEVPELYKTTFTVRGTKEQLKALKEFLENGGYEYGQLSNTASAV